MSNSRKRKYGMDEMCTNTSMPILFPLNTAVKNIDPEEPNISRTEECAQQKFTRPVQNILNLPPEMLLNIFLKLDHASIARCAQVCKEFNEVSKDSRLFRYVEVSSINHEPRKFAEWLLNRATNPREVFAVKGPFSDLISNKFCTWQNLEKLKLVNIHLEDVGEGSMKHLRNLSLAACKMNCKTLGKLLEHSNAICNVDLKHNSCYNCDEACNTGILSFLNSNTCVENLEKVRYHNYFTSTMLPDLHRLSFCASLKILDLAGNPEILNRTEATLAMEMIARKCTKLEEVSFANMGYITDNVLEILFTNGTNLKTLHFYNLRNITEKSCLVAIDLLLHLRKISFWFCALINRKSEGKLVDAISKLKSLVSTRTPPELEFVR